MRLYKSSTSVVAVSKWLVASKEVEIKHLSFVPSLRGVKVSETIINWSSIGPIKSKPTFNSEAGSAVSTVVLTSANIYLLVQHCEQKMSKKHKYQICV